MYAQKLTLGSSVFHLEYNHPALFEECVGLPHLKKNLFAMSKSHDHPHTTLFCYAKGAVSSTANMMCKRSDVSDLHRQKYHVLSYTNSSLMRV